MLCSKVIKKECEILSLSYIKNVMNYFITKKLYAIAVISFSQILRRIKKTAISSVPCYVMQISQCYLVAKVCKTVSIRWASAP